MNIFWHILFPFFSVLEVKLLSRWMIYQVISVVMLSFLIQSE